MPSNAPRQPPESCASLSPRPRAARPIHRSVVSADDRVQRGSDRWFFCGRGRAGVASQLRLDRGLVFATALVTHAVGPVGFLRLIEREHALGVLEAWDGRWYRMVATSGYLLVPGKQSDPAFFPLFPLLLRAVHVLGIGYAAGGLLLANAGFLVALVAFRALTAALFDPGLARRAVVYLAIFPFGYVFSMDYPESIVLALIVLAAL